jgi:hypothetical protein
MNRRLFRAISALTAWFFRYFLSRKTATWNG